MTVKEAYIHVQQGLQNIAAFVNRDIKLPELDYFWNQATDTFITLCVPDENKELMMPKNTIEKYSDVQASLDDLRVLEILGYTVSPLSTFTESTYTGKSITIPANYRHLLNDKTKVQPIGCSADKARVVPNRLTKRQDFDNVLENKYYKTDAESPVSSLSLNALKVYDSYKGVKQFDILDIYMDYLKNPAVVAYGVDGSSVLEFPNNVCFKIIKTTLIYISIVSEQNPNKIQLLEKI